MHRMRSDRHNEKNIAICYIFSVYYVRSLTVLKAVFAAITGACLFAYKEIVFVVPREMPDFAGNLFVTGKRSACESKGAHAAFCALTGDYVMSDAKHPDPKGYKSPLVSSSPEKSGECKWYQRFFMTFTATPWIERRAGRMMRRLSG